MKCPLKARILPFLIDVVYGPNSKDTSLPNDCSVTKVVLLPNVKGYKYMCSVHNMVCFRRPWPVNRLVLPFDFRIQK